MLCLEVGFCSEDGEANERYLSRGIMTRFLFQKISLATIEDILEKGKVRLLDSYS